MENKINEIIEKLEEGAGFGIYPLCVVYKKEGRFFMKAMSYNELVDEEITLEETKNVIYNLLQDQEKRKAELNS